jgi:hypothetical protein
MRVVFWLLVGIGCVYVFYSGAMAAYSYLQVNDIVTETVGMRSKLDRFERAPRVRDDILKRAPEAGLTLDERDVFVGEEDRTLRVLLRWSHPVIIYQGDAILAIPMSYDKSFEVPSGR